MQFSALLLAALLAFGSPAAIAGYTAPALTYDDLVKELPKDPIKRAQVLTRFAKDDDVALGDRRRAVKELLATLPPADARRVDVDLVDAHLAGVAKKSRAAILVRAKADAKKAHLDERADELQTLILAEGVLARLDGKKTAAADVVAAVERALPIWLAVGDEREHGVARIALARNKALSDVDGAVRDLDDAIDSLGKRRDTAGVRVDGWRLLATLQEPAHMDEAAAAALAADRAALVDVTMTNAPAKAVTSAAAATAPATTAKTATTATTTAATYARSKATAAVCARARAQNVSCAKIEQKRYGERSYYDFSKERGGAFEQKRADDVLAEFDSLLQDCLAKGAKANLTTNTHVELVWSVANNGLVQKAFDLAPQRLRGTMVESCLADAFAVFRYPPYRGEMQHVRLSFDVGE